MIEADKKILTEYLGLCWHDEAFDEEIGCHRCSCGMRFSEHKQLLGHIKNDNWARLPTFTTREDMMACYEAIWKAGEWENFHRRHILSQGFRILEGAFSAWLFCLSGSGYDAACQRVADWIKEANHEL